MPPPPPQVLESTSNFEVANERWYPANDFALTTHNGSLWLMGGMTMEPTYSANNLVWSSDDGESWREVVTEQEWFPRNGLSAADVEGELVVLGGSLYNDVHVMIPGPAPSSDNGLSLGVIVGISCAGLVFLGAAGYRGYRTLPGYYDKYKKEKAAQEQALSVGGLREPFHEDEHEQVANEFALLQNEEFDSMRDSMGRSGSGGSGSGGVDDFEIGWGHSNEKVPPGTLEPLQEADIEESLGSHVDSPFLKKH